MARFFNTAGPCNPQDHYMLPSERRLPGLMDDDLEDNLRFTIALGLIVSTSRGLEIANPIYREVIPRSLTSLPERCSVEEMTAEGKRIDVVRL